MSMKCTCKSGSLCQACVDTLLLEGKKIKIDVGWDRLKTVIGEIWSDSVDQLHAREKIAEYFVCGAEPRVWQLLGRTPADPGQADQHRATVWFNRGNIHVMGASAENYIQIVLKNKVRK